MESKNDIIGKNVPVPECTEKPFQYDCEGNFRIVVKGCESEWTSPHDIATLTIEGEWIGNDDIRRKEIYIGVSSVHTGPLPKECPLLVTEVDGDGDADFVHVKIVDLEADKILNEEDVDEQLYDSISEDDMGVAVRPSTIKDYVKLRITEYTDNIGEDNIMSKQDVENYIAGIFRSDEFDVLDTDGNKIN